jgi:hypothetical protein
MASARNVTAAAEAFGMDRVTVHRWIKAGKVPPPGGGHRGRRRAPRFTAPPVVAPPPVVVAPDVVLPADPAAWAASLRQSHDFADMTASAVLELGKDALTMARDTSLPPTVRLAATKTYLQIVRQLDLEDPTDGQAQTSPTTAPAPAGPASSGKAAASTAGGPQDPRWALMPWSRLTPAMKLLLMAGKTAEGRIRGWVALAQAGMHDEPDPEAVWERHHADFITEATAHHFKPHRLTGRRPTGPGFDAWRETFIRANTY